MMTPGPWRAVKTHPENPYWDVQSEAIGRTVATVYNDPKDASAVISNVNAVAAVPELVKELQDALHDLEFAVGIAGSLGYEKRAEGISRRLVDKRALLNKLGVTT